MSENSKNNGLITPPAPPVKPVFCHRVFANIPYLEQGITGSQPQPKAIVNMMQCVKAECALWDSVAKKCADKVKVEALQKIADLMEAKSKETTIDLQ